MERPSSCWDTCCFARGQEEFEALSAAQTLDVLKYNQVGHVGLLVLQIVAVLLWAMATGVPGFDVYDGSAHINANRHASWWLAIDVLVLCAGLVSPWFGLHYTRNGVIEKGLQRTYEWLAAYMVMAVLGAVALFVHWGLTWGEVATCDSTLCAQYKWCLIALQVGLFLHAVVWLWSALRALAYYHNLKRALLAGKLDLSISTGDGSPSPDDYTALPSAPADESQPPSAPPQADVPGAGAAITPLLQSRLGGGGGGGGKIRHTAPRHHVMRK